MICPNCKSNIPDDSRFCPDCGTPVKDMNALRFEVKGIKERYTKGYNYFACGYELPHNINNLSVEECEKIIAVKGEIVQKNKEIEIQEQQKREEEQRKREEELRKREEELRKREKERKLEEQRKKEEEAKRRKRSNAVRILGGLILVVIVFAAITFIANNNAPSIDLGGYEPVNLPEPTPESKPAQLPTTQRCSNCEGRGQIIYTCESCSGRGQILCSECRGEGTWGCDICCGVGCEYCDNGAAHCESCSGVGHWTCSKCNGAGTYEKICSVCNGRGLIYQ